MSEQNEYEVKLPSGMTVKVRNLMADYEALVTENKRLREALQPFADMLPLAGKGEFTAAVLFTVDLERAANALKRQPDDYAPDEAQSASDVSPSSGAKEGAG